MTEHIGPELAQYVKRSHPFAYTDDPRMKGGDGYTRTNCDLCEDEGIVWYYREHPQTHVWFSFTARCTCGSRNGLPREYCRRVSSKHTDKVMDIPTWRDVRNPKTGAPMFTEADILSSRLSAFMNVHSGILELPEHEPFRIKYRRLDTTKGGLDGPKDWETRQENQLGTPF